MAPMIDDVNDIKKNIEKNIEKNNVQMLINSKMGGIC